MIEEEDNHINYLNGNTNNMFSEDYSKYFISSFKPNNQVIYGELLLVGQENKRFQVTNLPCLIGRKENFLYVENNDTTSLVMKSTLDLLNHLNINTRNRVELLNCKCM